MKLKPLKDFILVDYKPESTKQLESGLYVLGEDAFDFLELSVISPGLGCELVSEGDSVLIRKESLFQAEVGQGLIFKTKEGLLYKLNNKMVNKYIYVKPITEEVTKSGLIILHQSDSVPQKAEVIEVGSKVEYVKAGQKVVVGKHAMSNKYDDGYFVHEDDVLGIIQED